MSAPATKPPSDELVEAGLSHVPNAAKNLRMMLRSDLIVTLMKLADKLEQEAKQYQAVVDECRAKQLEHQCTLGMKTALQQAAKELRDLLRKHA